jgi:hypothetical protein
MNESIQYIYLFQAKIQEHVCDLSAINLLTPGQPIQMSCSMLFACGTLTTDSSDISITSEAVFVSEGTTIQNVPPSKAARGTDGTGTGDSGTHGQPGIAAYNMNLVSNKQLRESGQNIIFISQGGAGGDGGNGKSGRSNLDQIPSDPADANEVVAKGLQVDYTKECDKHCGRQCKTCDEYWYHAIDVDLPTQACGGNGGNGGNGGGGGSAGIMTTGGTSGLIVSNKRLESAGGAAGIGAAEASGLKIKRHFTGYRYCQRS